MSEKMFDFDNFMSEQNEKNKPKPVIIRIFGENEELPPSLPADLVLRIIRLHRAGVENVDEEQIFLISERIFGKERFEKWLEKGLTIDQLGMLIGKTVEIYMQDQKRHAEKVEKAGNSTKTP